MMGTLLMRLAGPLQSYGVDSKFDVRMTGSVPTKSAVTGLISAALGRGRDVDISDVAALRFGVRVDRPGKLHIDYQTAKAFDKGGKSADKHNIVGNRYYLTDAIFLAGVEGENCFLEEIGQALLHPGFQLYLGRRACPVTLPLFLGVREASLEEALSGEDWLVNEKYRSRCSPNLQIFLESRGADGITVRDMPVSFSRRDRLYEYRAVKVVSVYKGEGLKTEEQGEHDPFSPL